MQNWVKEIVVDSKFENVRTLTDFVESSLEPLHPSPKAIMQIGVAIDVLTAKLTFIDEGVEYDPLKKTDPDVSLSAEDREIGGLGIFLVKKIMDGVEYKRDGQKNILTVVKKLG